MALAFEKVADEEPIATAVITYYEELRVFLRRKVGCPAAAADILQETYIRVATAQAGGGIDNPRAYLYRVAANLATDHQRRHRVHDRLFDPEAIPETVVDHGPDAERSLTAKQRLNRLRQAVAELPPRCRTVFVMRRFDDIEQDEIARRLGISRNMVEKHLRHALSHCAQRLSDAD